MRKKSLHEMERVIYRQKDIGRLKDVVYGYYKLGKIHV